MTNTATPVITLLDTAEETDNAQDHAALSSAASHWVQSLHHNLGRTHNLTIDDIMIPRADIKALNIDEQPEQLLQAMIDNGFSRYPVYRGSLDRVLGTIHIRDAFECVIKQQPFDLAAMVHPCLFVAPSMTVPDMLIEMREKRIHLALVVDEFGGNDGLVTIEDLIEQIIGAIEDEHDDDTGAMLIHEAGGTILTSARIRLEELEKTIGIFQTKEDQREDVDTLGGLVYGMLGRIPKRGELVQHDSGLQFEIVDVDVRFIRQMRIRNLPKLQPKAVLTD